MEQESSEKVAISDIPKRLFKYYKYDPKYNESRLSGEVFLSSPKNFNDPFDCQLGIENNAEAILRKKEKDSVSKGKWLEHKLIELGYQEEDLPKYLNGLLEDKKEIVDEVYDKQLQNIGILCTIPENDNLLMWSYYTNLEGFCIEYDTEKIIRDLTIGFIKTLDYQTLNHLYNTKQYKSPQVLDTEQDTYKKSKRDYADLIFTKDITEIIKQLSCLDKEGNNDEAQGFILNFIKNVYIKRIDCNNILYTNEIKNTFPNLFYDRENQEGNNQNIRHKYYTKSKKWEHEKEFRFFISLGGNKTIGLSKECIKAVYFGPKMSERHILEMSYFLYEKYDDKMNDIKLFRMIVNKEKGNLTAKEILSSKRSKEIFDTFKELITPKQD